MALAGCIGLELIFAYYISTYQRTYVILVPITCTSVSNSICLLDTTFYPPRIVTWQF